MTGQHNLANPALNVALNYLYVITICQVKSAIQKLCGEESDPLDGVIRVQYRSSPYTKATVVDSSPVAAVATPRGADTVWL